MYGVCGIFLVLPTVCVYPISCKGGMNLFGDHRGSVLSNRAETSQEGYCRRKKKYFRLGENQLKTTLPEFTENDKLYKYLVSNISNSTLKHLIFQTCMNLW